MVVTREYATVTVKSIWVCGFGPSEGFERNLKKAPASFSLVVASMDEGQQ